MKTLKFAVAVAVVLIAETVLAAPWSDWTSAANNVNIAYHFRLWENSQSCEMEFKDVNQGDGPTTFDAAVDYQASEPNLHQARVQKTDNLHIATTIGHNGQAQIPNCYGIVEVRVSFIQRH